MAKDVEKHTTANKELVSQQQVTFSEFAGPIPPPEILERYNAVVPNAAERIITMAEKQQEHRISIENKVVSSNIFNEKFGIICSLIIGLTGLICATICAMNGAQTTAVVIGGATLTSLVGVFVYGRHSRKKELARKATNESSPQ